MLSLCLPSRLPVSLPAVLATVLIPAVFLPAVALAQTETVLVNFTGTSGTAPGRTPKSGNLIQASDGSFYGVSLNGGANDSGVAFKVSVTGAYTLLHTFVGSNPNDALPAGGLVQGTDGNFYGTTQAGGSSHLGTVYTISPAGTFTSLHSFTNADGNGPLGALVQGTDGSFYGTTLSGGVNSLGTVFKIDSTGAFALLHSFSSSNADGQSPQSGLVQGADGTFYGTTSSGGANGQGTIYKITPTGSFTLLYSFSGPTDGANPAATLVQGADGSFYGTARDSGPDLSFGTAFKISSTGTFTLLHSFGTGAFVGQAPSGALVLGTDGSFYGTTFGSSSATTSSYGTLFKMTPTGTLTLLYSFGSTEARNPSYGLVQGADGGFYGTTELFSTSIYGTVFKLDPATALTGPVSLSLPQSIVPGAAFSLSYSVANAYSATLQQCFATNTAGDTAGWTGIKTGSPTTISTSLTAPSTPGTYIYTLTCGGRESGRATLSVAGASAAPIPTLLALNWSNSGAGTTFTAKLSPDAAAGATADGTVVTFYDGSSPIGTGTLSGGIASFTLATPMFYAVFPGTTVFNSSTSNSVQPAALPIATTSLALSSSNSGGNTTYTVSLYPFASATGTTSGETVTLQVSGSLIGTANLANGVATITLPSPAPGTYVRATYPGDSNFTPSASNSVQPAGPSVVPTSLALTSSNSGGNTTYALSLYPFVNAGLTTDGEILTLRINGTADGTAIGTATLASGVAKVTLPTPAPGASVRATYPGDTTFTSSTSNPVLPGGSASTPTSMALVSSLNPASPGSTNVVKALLYPYSQPGSQTSNGETVTFIDQYGATIGTATLLNGTATLNTSAFLAGKYTLQAIYNGDANLSSSASNQITQTFQ